MMAVLLALVSALSFAASTVVQHRAATDATVPPGRWSAVRLAWHLVRQPPWLAGVVAAGLGFLFHGLALRAGPVVLVQPLLSSGLVITLGLGALVDRRHRGRPLPSGRQWAAAGVVVAGLVVFLLAASPAAGRDLGRAPVLLAASGGALAVTALGWVWSRNPARPHRALALGVAAGCGYGMTGVLLKQAVHRLPTTWAGLWPWLLLLAVGGIAGVCAQGAYAAGALVESVPSLTVLEPVVAIAVASLAYGETLAGGALEAAGQAVGLVILAIGVTGIARAEAARAASPTNLEGDVPVGAAAGRDAGER